jgi:release factor glutamine methyltransferase
LKNPTVREALRSAIERLKASGIPDAESEAEFLLTHLLKIKRHQIFINPERPMAEGEAVAFDSFIERRLRREPAQYITGETEFRGLELKVTKDTLIPRPETELLVDAALNTASTFRDAKTLTVIDLCTGSGCIAISFTKEFKDCRVLATDVSGAALKVAKENAERHGVSDRVEFIEGDLFTPLEGKKAHLILSNPPYVSEAEMKALEPEIAHWEPHAALRGGEDGLFYYRRIIEGAPAHLLPNGSLIIEIGWGQAARIRELLGKSGLFTDISIGKDYGGVERVVTARLK